MPRDPDSSRPAGPAVLSPSHSLGLEQPIARRDFLNAALLASGDLLLSGRAPHLLTRDWTGPGGVGDYRRSNGNTEAVMNAGHLIRDEVYARLPASAEDTGEIYDLAVIGGGISGLAAALFLDQAAGGKKSCLVLDNHPIFGGEAKRNEFLVDGRRLLAHQGSAVYFTPFPYSTLARFYRAIGLDPLRLAYQRWAGPEPEIPLGRTPYEAFGSVSPVHGVWFGARFGQTPGLWLLDPWKNRLRDAPISAAARRDLLRWHRGGPRHAPPFQPPTAPGDAVSRSLDAQTMEAHLMARYGIARPTVRTFLASESDDYGLGPDAVSGFCPYAADFLPVLDAQDPASTQMFPDGNAGISRLLVKALIPAALPGPANLAGVYRSRVHFAALDRPGQNTRLRLDSTVVSVRHLGAPGKAEFVEIAYYRAGRVYKLRARAAVMAGGGWTTRHIVRDLPDHLRRAYAQFYRSPCLIANVAVRHWRFLYRQGISGAHWFEGFGRYLQVRRQALLGPVAPTLGPDQPTVLTLKLIYSYPGLSTREQGDRGRVELLSTSYRDYELQIRRQLAAMFSRSGFDPRRDIAGIILNRWGHAYLSPQPGFFFGLDGLPAPRESLRRAPFGRIAFANTDLAGLPDHRHSILEAQRAVGQLLAAVLD